jgi:hypothetical protein
MITLKHECFWEVERCFVSVCCFTFFFPRPVGDQVSRACVSGALLMFFFLWLRAMVDIFLGPVARNVIFWVVAVVLALVFLGCFIFAIIALMKSTSSYTLSVSTLLTDFGRGSTDFLAFSETLWTSFNLFLVGLVIISCLITLVKLKGSKQSSLAVVRFLAVAVAIAIATVLQAFETFAWTLQKQAPLAYRLIASRLVADALVAVALLYFSLAALMARSRVSGSTSSSSTTEPLLDESSGWSSRDEVPLKYQV